MIRNPFIQAIAIAPVIYNISPFDISPLNAPFSNPVSSSAQATMLVNVDILEAWVNSFSAIFWAIFPLWFLFMIERWDLHRIANPHSKLALWSMQ